jgi:RNA polymerase sigma factor (sigma-70 family)
MTNDGPGMPLTRESIEAELERHHRAGFAWALACCGRDREEAEDVLQASYLKLLDGRARYEGRSSFRTFLFGVIRRTASESRRRGILRRAFAASPRPESPPPAGPGVEERLALVAALGRLPRRQREMVELVFYSGMTVDEAGATLGVSAGSARVHYDRGKKRLARLLGIAR